MILNKRSKVSDVSLQGTLHAVVPVTGEHSEGQAKKRLIRALLEVGDKYGMRLSFVPDKPRDYKNEGLMITGHGQQCYAPASVDLNGDYTIIQCDSEGRVITSPHSPVPGSGTVALPQGVTITRDPPSDELPQCTLSEETRKLALRHITDPAINFDMTASEWLTITKVEYGEENLYISVCPFCEKDMVGTHVNNERKKPMKQVRRLLDKCTCLTCQIAFTWNFDKNTVKMEKMGGESKAKPANLDKVALKAAIEEIDNQWACSVKKDSAGILVKIYSKPERCNHARQIAETISRHVPKGLGLEIYGDARYILDSGREVRWSWI